MMTKNIRDEEIANSCLVDSSCGYFTQLRGDIVRSLGSAAAQAVTVAGNRKAKENGTCTAYEIYEAFRGTISPETTRKMFGEGYDKNCPYNGHD